MYANKHCSYWSALSTWFGGNGVVVRSPLGTQWLRVWLPDNAHFGFRESSFLSIFPSQSWCWRFYHRIFEQLQVISFVKKYVNSAQLSLLSLLYLQGNLIFNSGQNAKNNDVYVIYSIIVLLVKSPYEIKLLFRIRSTVFNVKILHLLTPHPNLQTRTLEWSV